jgi:Ankyrin repeats (many copies)
MDDWHVVRTQASSFPFLTHASIKHHCIAKHHATTASHFPSVRTYDSSWCEVKERDQIIVTTTKAASTRPSSTSSSSIHTPPFPASHYCTEIMPQRGGENGVVTLGGENDQTRQQQQQRKRSFDELIQQSLDAVVVDAKACNAIMGQWGKLIEYQDDDDDDDTFSETDESSDDSDSSSLDECEEKEETLVVQALVKAAFSQTVATPSLDKLLCQSLSRNKRARLDLPTTVLTKLPKTSNRTCAASPSSSSHILRLSASEPFLSRFQKSVQTAVPCWNQEAAAFATTKPDDYLRSLMQSSSSSSGTTTPETQPAIQYYAATSLHGFFQELSTEAVASYDTELAQAVRLQNVDTLRALWKQRGNLHAGNKFGETILHSACRRGSVPVLQFLLHEARVPLRVCCDSGRTPLSDACWTTSPESNTSWTVLMDLILDECPEFLYITDKRGFTPLSYVPRKHWGEWCLYLRNRGVDRLRPKEQLQQYTIPS